jgi:hypothetical protein
MEDERKKCETKNDEEKSTSPPPCETIVLVEKDQTCGGRFQSRIPPVGILRETECVPGAVYVVFNPGFQPGPLNAALSDTESIADTDEDFEELLTLLRELRLVSCEPTFSFTPPGLPPEESPPPGRERYYTLRFPPEEDMVYISEALCNLSLVERAALVPRIVPPTNPVA